MFGEGTYVNFIMVLISRKEKQFYANTTMKREKLEFPVESQ